MNEDKKESMEPRQRQDGSTIDNTAKGVGDGEGDHQFITSNHRDVAQINVLDQSKSLDGRYRGIIEAVPDALVIVNHAGIIVLVNGQAEALFGYRRDDLIGKPMEVLLAERYRHRHITHRGGYFAEPKTGNTDWIELFACRKDGSEFAVEINLGPLDSDEGSFAVSAIRDITDRKQLQEELRRNHDVLAKGNPLIQQNNRLKGEFLANMSHELRTPLNGIIGFAEIMHDEKVGPISTEHKEYLRDILTSGRHLLRLINDVLDLSTMEAGKLDFFPELTDPANLVAEVCEILRTPAAKKRIKIETQCDLELAAIQADPRSLKQILYNYVSNALKFTPNGGKVTVRVKAEDNDHFRIEVEDTGIGIGSEDLSLLFVEFHRLETGGPEQYAGTGLGLALTKKIVEAQRGEVGVTSTPGRGSMFYARLPRVLTAAQPETSAAPRDQRLPPVQAGAPLILIIEDDAGDRAWIAQAVRAAGYAVEAVATGAEALVRCREQKFDAITLDIMLPDMSGRAVLEKLRERGLNQHTPVTVVTLLANKGAVAGFQVNDILAKPVSQSDIVKALERCGLMPSTPRPILGRR